MRSDRKARILGLAGNEHARNRTLQDLQVYSKVFLPGLLNMREMQILTSVIERALAKFCFLWRHGFEQRKNIPVLISSTHRKLQLYLEAYIGCLCPPVLILRYFFLFLKY